MAERAGHRLRTMKRTIMVVVLGCVLAACGGNSSPASTATAPIETTTEVSVPFANVATTTSVAMSRDARLAMERCRKALGQFFASQIGPLGGGHAQIKETEALCDEAELQLTADNPSSGSVSGQLVAELARLKLSIGFADLKVLSDKFDTAAEQTLQTDVDAFDKKVDELLGA